MELMHFHIFSMPLFVFCVSLLQLCLDLFMHLSFTFFYELFNLLFLLVGFYSLFFLLVIYRVKWWLWKELITNFKWYHVSRWVNCPIACMLNVGFHPISWGDCDYTLSMNEHVWYWRLVRIHLPWYGTSGFV
jgi:hypothetical protein